MRNVPWSATERRRLLEAAAEFGPDRNAIAAAVGRSPGIVDNYINHSCRPEYHKAVESWRLRREAQMEVAPPEAPGKHLGQTLTWPVQPFEVPYATPILPEPEDGDNALYYSDSHWPFQDEAAIGCVMGVASDAKPRRVVHGGDALDCWRLSRFLKNPKRRDWLQDNIDAFRIHLGQMRQLLPNSELSILEGNHEARLTKMLWGLEGPGRELPRLRKVEEAASWPSLLDLKTIGWKWVGERDQSHTQLLPKVISKHGTVLRKWSGWSAKGEWEKYGRAGISSHTHRLGCFFHRDHNGVVQWWESGCTCSLEPEYGTDFDWQQGFLYMTWSKDLALWNVEPVSIRDGRCLWRGKVYKG